MRIAGSLLVVAALASEARGDVFAFKTVDGYEACLRTDHVVEKIDTAKGSQTRVLDQGEIIVRCIDAAVKLVAGKPVDEIRAFIQTTQRLTAHANAIELVGVLAATSLPQCNDSDAYDVIVAALSMPPRNRQVAKARGVVRQCLKDAAFRKDFLEEKDSSNSYLAENACSILVEAKLIKACK